MPKTVAVDKESCVLKVIKRNSITISRLHFGKLHPDNPSTIRPRNDKPQDIWVKVLGDHLFSKNNQIGFVSTKVYKFNTTLVNFAGKKGAEMCRALWRLSNKSTVSGSNKLFFECQLDMLYTFGNYTFRKNYCIDPCIDRVFFLNWSSLVVWLTRKGFVRLFFWF